MGQSKIHAYFSTLMLAVMLLQLQSLCISTIYAKPCFRIDKSILKELKLL